jgi:TolA-binding protein
MVDSTGKTVRDWWSVIAGLTGGLIIVGSVYGVQSAQMAAQTTQLNRMEHNQDIGHDLLIKVSQENIEQRVKVAQLFDFIKSMQGLIERLEERQRKAEDKLNALMMHRDRQQ